MCNYLGITPTPKFSFKTVVEQFFSTNKANGVGYKAFGINTVIMKPMSSVID